MHVCAHLGIVWVETLTLQHISLMFLFLIEAESCWFQINVCAHWGLLWFEKVTLQNCSLKQLCLIDAESLLLHISSFLWLEPLNIQHVLLNVLVLINANLCVILNQCLSTFGFPLA